MREGGRGGRGASSPSSAAWGALLWTPLRAPWPLSGLSAPLALPMGEEGVSQAGLCLPRGFELGLDGAGLDGAGRGMGDAPQHSIVLGVGNAAQPGFRMVNGGKSRRIKAAAACVPGDGISPSYGEQDVSRGSPTEAPRREEATSWARKCHVRAPRQDLNVSTFPWSRGHIGDP